MKLGDEVIFKRKWAHVQQLCYGIVSIVWDDVSRVSLEILKSVQFPEHSISWNHTSLKEPNEMIPYNPATWKHLTLLFDKMCKSQKQVDKIMSETFKEKIRF